MAFDLSPMCTVGLGWVEVLGHSEKEDAFLRPRDKPNSKD